MRRGPLVELSIGYTLRPMQPKHVRPWTLKASDPIAVLVAGVVLLLTTLGLHVTLGVGAEDLARYEAGALIAGGLVRYMLERSNDKRVAQRAEAMEAQGHREGLAKPTPPPGERQVWRVGAPHEGGRLEAESLEDLLDDDDPHTDGKNRKPRRG